MWGRPGRKAFLSPCGSREKRGRKLAGLPRGSAVFAKLDGHRALTAKEVSEIHAKPKLNPAAPGDVAVGWHQLRRDHTEAGLLADIRRVNKVHVVEDVEEVGREADRNPLGQRRLLAERRVDSCPCPSVRSWLPAPHSDLECSHGNPIRLQSETKMTLRNIPDRGTSAIYSPPGRLSSFPCWVCWVQSP